MTVQQLMEEYISLPPESQRQVEDFVASLCQEHAPDVPPDDLALIERTPKEDCKIIEEQPVIENKPLRLKDLFANQEELWAYIATFDAETKKAMFDQYLQRILFSGDDNKDEPYSFPEVSEMFREADVREPDVMFGSCELEKNYREGCKDINPLKEIGGKPLSGCYAWFDEGEWDANPQVMYVGKAVKLRNRLVQHWNNYSEFLGNWCESCEDDGRVWAPCVAVWFTEDKAAMEVDLTHKLKPKFGRRRE